MDTEAFNACLESGKYTDLVQSETSRAQSLGVRGTPTFVINGRAMSGALPFETFQQLIDEALAKTDSGTQTSTSSAPEPTNPPATGGLSSEPGQAVPIQGNAHIKEGESHPDYNSDPPTSGWHLDRAIPAGFYEESQLDEALVHNLEHGHIVIAYDCGKLADPSTGSGQRCEAVKAKLKDLVNRYDGWKVTVVPRQNKDTAIALTAWGRIAKLDAYDEARIMAFIDAYRDQGPEKTPE